jgi:hypothetical protein
MNNYRAYDFAAFCSFARAPENDEDKFTSLLIHRPRAKPFGIGGCVTPLRSNQALDAAISVWCCDSSTSHCSAGGGRRAILEPSQFR